LALLREAEGAVDTNWDADAGELAQAAKPLPSDPEWAGERVFTDDRTLHFPELTSERIWPVIESIGGRNGWYSWPLAWKVRGVWDKIVGGAGLNRGRRLPDRLRVGDPVDWWRVEELEPEHRLLLRAEMRVSGSAWLEFTTTDAGRGCEFRQRAIFIPKGVRGRVYWAFVSPFHRFIFPAMAKNIARAAKKSHLDRRRELDR
ncbi:MAG: DUF2867 domain-containing protein, partial [Brevibacterium sp.]|nr:DUF2867 domain-containing protein [Brevibacterium sp.]